jgi:hypothetical protein
MNIQITSDSDHKISRLRSAARTGSLRAVIGELAAICSEITAEQCSRLARLVPRLSVDTARVSIRIDE